MTIEKEQSPTSTEARQNQLRKLEHDMKTYLGVVTMGIQALEGVREDLEEFAELRNMIEEEGVKPLKEIIAEIIAVALAKQD